MSLISENQDLKNTIDDFSRAYQRWQRAASAHSVLLQIQEGELPPPTIELSSTGAGGEPVRVALDLSRLQTAEVGGIIGPMIDFLYREYKQSLYDAGMAASASHRILETHERSRVSDIPYGG